jgi:hypothetical protein
MAEAKMLHRNIINYRGGSAFVNLFGDLIAGALGPVE